MHDYQAQPKEMIQLCSAVMRAPQVFDQYGPHLFDESKKRPVGVESLARDLVIYLAWNGVEQVRLNAREFAKMFGYTHAYLFKKLTDEQRGWLKLKQFNPATHKDLLTYTLARLFIEQANFPPEMPLTLEYVDGPRTGERVEVYEGLQFISGIWVNKATTGSTYKFLMNPAFLRNCQSWYQSFDLNEYLQLKSTSGRAWNAGRRMYLHLAWKRGVWDEAENRGKGHGHDQAQLRDLLQVAGYRYADERRKIHELRQLLDDLALFSAIRMRAEIKLNEVGSYEVRFERIQETVKRAATA